MGDIDNKELLRDDAIDELKNCDGFLQFSCIGNGFRMIRVNVSDADIADFCTSVLKGNDAIKLEVMERLKDES